MAKLLKKAWHYFLDIFGDIKVSKYPMWVQYDPEYFKMSGEQILEVLKYIKVGDIILRGYDAYADGYFIPESDGHGRYSHAGMYTGLDMVTHAISPCIQQTHIIEFLECDRVAILRPIKKHVTKAVAAAKKYFQKQTKYDFDFEVGDAALYCFEMCAECYNYLNISRKDAKVLGGLIQKKNCFLASSFFESPDFQVVYEYNPANDIAKNIMRDSCL